MNNIFKAITKEILSIRTKPALIIAVDGVDGAGKTCFAKELKAHLEGAGKDVVLISMDNFHNPQSIRYAKGKDSAAGFYYDSYDYESFTANVIRPFQGYKNQYVTRVFDLEADKPLIEVGHNVLADSILVIEGLFLHRPELSAFWHYSIFLDITAKTSLVRNIERSNAHNNVDGIKEMERRFFARYRPGQELYFKHANPLSKASIVINNNDYLNPEIAGRNVKIDSEASF